jgi:DNA-binding LytR/AlgR family response regulator
MKIQKKNKNLCYKEITSLISDTNYTMIYFSDGSTLYSSYTLGYYEKKYATISDFLRVNRKTIINKNYFESCKTIEGKFYVALTNGNTFQVSRRRKGVMERF